MRNSTTKLSVNVNAVAYLRNRRSVSLPNILDVSRVILDAGAHGITVHPRPDQRHISYSDVLNLSNMINSEYPEAELNVEGNPTPEFIKLLQSIRAHQVTLVPDEEGQITSDHGWDFTTNEAMLTDMVKLFKKENLRVSLFINANKYDPLFASRTGSDCVEFYTGPYGGQANPKIAKTELEKIVDAASAVRKIGREANGVRRDLKMNAGHDLNMHNLSALIGRIPDLAEVSIGHAITSEALMLGFPQAVRKYLEILSANITQKS